MCPRTVWLLATVAVMAVCGQAPAGVGDPQIMTDHPYFGGELSCSTMRRTIETAYRQYRHRTGLEVVSDQDKALALWYWRNTHFWHTEDAYLDYWGTGFGDGQAPSGGDMFPREYWLGLFSQGSALCGAAHAQFSALIQTALGPGTARVVGVSGHNSHEVWLTGGAYGDGRWAVLDADMSIVVFDEQGGRLCSLTEVIAKPKLADPGFKPERQHGWPLSGVSANGASGTLTKFNTAEYNPGYLGAPPILYLPDGTTFRRYPQPGLGGKTYCFWGVNYNKGGVAGPARDRTWTRDPERMYQGPRLAIELTGPIMRYGNGVFTYRGDFAGGGYKQAIVDESPRHVTIEFSSPYLIACTPADNSKWGVFKPGATNGLILTGRAECPVAVSTDWGQSWTDCGRFGNGMDLTDLVKGRRQYLLRLGAPASKLAGSGLVIRTVVHIGSAVFPHLKSGGSRVTCLVGGYGLRSVGPFIDQVRAAVAEGKLDKDSRVVMRVATPRGERIAAVHAAAHVRSGVPPNPDVRYQIELSTDNGKTWADVVKDWKVVRRPVEPKDFWSQGFVWGSVKLSRTAGPEALVRFSNDGDITYGRCEVHLVYVTKQPQSLTVRYCWEDKAGSHIAERSYTKVGNPDWSWVVPTGDKTSTKWVELSPAEPSSQ